MTEDSKPYFTSKSGKKLSIQHGTTWYEEHDTKKYIIFKVLVQSIPYGHTGYNTLQTAERKLEAAMKLSRFGPCYQIASMVRIGDGGMREHRVYLLTKYQALYIASRLSSAHLHIVTSHFYDSLTEAEKNMEASVFLQMLQDKGDTLLMEAAKAETPTQFDTRLTAALQLKQSIAELKDLTAVKETANEAKHQMELAEIQVELFSGITDVSHLPDHLRDYSDTLVEAACKVREATNVLLNTRVLPGDNVSTTVEEISKLVNDANDALCFLKEAAKTYTNSEQIAKYMPYDNSPIVEVRYRMEVVLDNRVIINNALKKQGIDASDAKYKNFCRDDLIEFGLYAVLYDRMAMMDHYYALCNEYKAKYKYTDKQISAIFTVMEYSLQLTLFNRGVILIEHPNMWSWRIYSASR